MRVFTNKQELLEWHKEEADGWRKYEKALHPDERTRIKRAQQAAEMHESAVHVLETLE